MTERDLVQSILVEFGARTDLRIWRQNTGCAIGRAGLIRFGLPGMADISGIQFGTGRRIEIECKTATGRQSDAQRKWQAMIENAGGIYILARSVDDVRRVLAP